MGSFLKSQKGLSDALEKIWNRKLRSKRIEVKEAVQRFLSFSEKIIR
ncbi:MAG: hypothetical protein QXX95_06915 [Nitrososphaerales archaeon]